MSHAEMLESGVPVEEYRPHLVTLLDEIQLPVVVMASKRQRRAHRRCPQAR